MKTLIKENGVCLCHVAQFGPGGAALRNLEAILIFSSLVAMVYCRCVVAVDVLDVVEVMVVG